MAKSLIRRLARDDRGVSAVEFALVAPVMLLFYAGMVDLCQGYMAFNRTSSAASSLADLVSQSTTTTADQVKSMFEAAPAIMVPFPTGTLEQRVSSVTRKSSKEYVRNWSMRWPNGGANNTTLKDALVVANAGIPADMLTEDGASVIVAETVYRYQSPFQKFLPNIRFYRKSYWNPRGPSVTCADCTN